MVRRLQRAALLIGLALPSPIVRRADQPDARYIALGARFPAVVALGRVGDATLVGDQWLITAAHVARAVGNGRVGRTITIEGHAYAIAGVALYPSWRDLGEHDVGLIRLDAPVTGLKPLALHRALDERDATSRVDSTSAAWLYFSFDAPPGGTELEGAPGPGDSGGPAILDVAGTPTVAGISSAGYDGRNGPGTYGAVDVFTRVSTHITWIDSVMHAPWTGSHAGAAAPPPRTARSKIRN